MSKNRKANSSILPPIDTIKPSYTFAVPKTGNKHLAGQIISLNAKEGLTFAIGDIELTTQKYWATVSDGMPDSYYDIIQGSIEDGRIVLGKKHIPAYDKPAGVVEEYYTAIKGGKNAKSVAKFRALIKKGTDRNYTIAEIATGCIKVERATKNREEVLKFLQDVLAFHEGQFSYLAPYDEEEGKVEVKIVDGAVVNPGKEPPRPPSVPVGGKSKDEALGELFS